MRQSILIVLFAFVASLSVATAQTKESMIKVNRTEGENFLIDFKFDKSVIDSGYMNNSASLRELDQILTNKRADIDSMIIIASASPEGVVKYNQTLATRRANAVKRYILWKYPFLNQHPIYTYSVGENWEGLRQLVEADGNAPYKEQILKIIASDITPSSKEWRLKQIGQGQAWSYIANHYLRYLRTGATCVVFYEKKVIESSQQIESSALMPSISEMPADSISQKPLPTINADSCASAICDQTNNSCEQQQLDEQQQTEQTQIVLPQECGQRHPFKPIIGLKTDLMLWGGVMPGFKMGTWTPNLSVEVYFARRWSVQLSGAYANWNALSGEKKLYAVSSTNLEGRYWFDKTSAYKGFYLGLYVQCGEYDVQRTAENQTGSFYGGGLGAGYLLPLSKHWGVEAQILGGYRSASNDLYDIEGEHYYFNRNENVGKFVPQFKLQIVYRFGKSGK